MDVWGFTEVAEFLDLSRPRVLALTNRDDFPKPIANLSMGRVWLADDVREWARRRRRRYPGPVDEDENL